MLLFWFMNLSLVVCSVIGDQGGICSGKLFSYYTYSLSQEMFEEPRVLNAPETIVFCIVSGCNLDH